MPIKPTKPPASASKSLVPVGPRHVSRTAKGKQDKDEGPPKEKASTTRALVLRNGKHGARGTGELMLMKKMTGREKFELIAEEEIKTAIMPPFSLEKCLKISESQYDAYLDDIANLRDPDLFRYIIEAELQARTQPGSETRRNPTYVAKVVGTRIHNAYLLASAWKMVQDTLNGLTIDGLSDRMIKVQLKNDKDMRDRFLVLYDMVNVLVEMSHAKFSVLATTTPHYAKYFKKSEVSAPGEEEMVFDWKDLRGAADSFLDSIIIELCFPRAPYPKAILYRILHDAIGESPREAKRFPQALWDAVGDLSESVELQQYLEGVLSGSDGQSWKKSARQMPEEYELWIDAQILSSKASAEIANFKDAIYPLEKTRQTVVLDNMWKFINLNYQAVSGHNIDTLWQLEGELDYAPQWSSYFIPDLPDDSDDDSDAPPRLVSVSKAGQKKRKRLAITNGADYEGTDSMPELQSVSNSSDDDDVENDADSDYDDDDEGDSDGSDYDEEAEDEIREMLREAMDAAHEADWFESNVSPELDPFAQEDRKGNPFLKLLGSLRGRMFPSSPKLKTPGTRTEVRPGIRGAFRATPSGVPKPPPTTGPPKAVPVSAKVATTAAASAKGWAVEPPKSLKATIEEVEDEDDTPLVAKKKKKKPKKKKKLAPASPEPRDVSQQSPPTSPTPARSAKLSTPLQAPASPSPKRNQAAPRPSPAKPAQPQMSTTSLAIPVEPTTAQSAHSYLRTLEEREKVKEKIKSRPDHASLFSHPEKEKKKGILAKLGVGLKSKEDATPKNAKHTWFSRLSKKTTGYMHQLLGTSEDMTQGIAEMKWENFLKLMREMGFEYDPSTAGSSVRFDPPYKGDKPITFHKPHPDPTLKPAMLKAFAKRLKRHYGWTEEDFLSHLPGSK